MGRPRKYSDEELIDFGKKIAEERQCGFEDVSPFAIQKITNCDLNIIRKAWEPFKKSNRKEKVDTDIVIVYPEVIEEVQKALSSFQDLPQLLSKIITRVVNQRISDLTLNLEEEKKKTRELANEAMDFSENIELSKLELETKLVDSQKLAESLILEKGRLEGQCKSISIALEKSESKNSSLLKEMHEVAKERDLAVGKLERMDSEIKALNANVKSQSLKVGRLEDELHKKNE